MYDAKPTDLPHPIEVAGLLARRGNPDAAKAVRNVHDLANDLARRLTIKGDAAYVMEAYRQAGIPVPPLVEREGTGED